MTPGQIVLHNTITGRTRGAASDGYGIQQQSGTPNVIKNNMVLQEDNWYVYIDGGGERPGIISSMSGPMPTLLGTCVMPAPWAVRARPAAPHPSSTLAPWISVSAPGLQPLASG